MADVIFTGVTVCGGLDFALVTRTVKSVCVPVWAFGGFLASSVSASSAFFLTEVAMGGGVGLEARISTAGECIGTTCDSMRKIPWMNLSI